MKLVDGDLFAKCRKPLASTSDEGHQVLLTLQGIVLVFRDRIFDSNVDRTLPSYAASTRVEISSNPEAILIDL